MTLAEGSDTASFILGANDYRLRHSVFNPRLLEGENYVRVELDLSGLTAEGGEFSYARGSYDSVYGTIESGWTAEDGALASYDCVVPANTRATLYLPAASVEGVEAADVVMHNGQSTVEIELPAGVWHFDIADGVAMATN